MDHKNMNLFAQGDRRISGYFQCAIFVHFPPVPRLKGELLEK